MTKINVYLNFPGNAEEAFGFYRSIFGGDFASVVRFKDMPMDGTGVPRDAEEMMMHMALPIGDDLLMASDAPRSMGQNVAFGNHAYISVHPDTREEADRIFNGLSAGGEVEMPIADQVWGDHYGSLKDRFGVMWMVNFSPAGQR